MNPRLIILILVAGGMAIYFAAAKSGTKAPEAVELENNDDPTRFPGTLDSLPLNCTASPEAPNLSVSVEVDRSKGKNRLYFTVNEAHGYYVEQFRVRFWHVRDGKTDPEDSPLVVTQFFDQYLPAKGTLRMCMEVVPAELVRVGGDIGDTSNWRSEIVYHGRACTQNPDPLPPRTDIVDCD